MIFSCADPAPEADTDDREWETVMRRARWCHRFGEPCWKRDATSDPPETGFCHRVGEPCWKVKRAAEAMAAAIAESEEEAESKPGKCNWPLVNRFYVSNAIPQ